LNDYDYYLPPELIAQEPLVVRDNSRMLALSRKSSTITHDTFKSFPTYLGKKDLLVLNNTRVIPARLFGTIEGKNIKAEILLLNRLDKGNWIAMVKPGRRLKPGVNVLLDLGVKAVIADYAPEGLREICFKAPEPFETMLPRLGKVPLPPYIKKDVTDPNQYQTIYALKNGSAAAPTAGFHFTESVFSELDKKGIERAFITLHIGPGTFQPVKAEDIREHVMHREYYQIGKETVEKLNQTRTQGGRIVAVGTTVCRVLESVIDGSEVFHPREGWTNLYIYPGYQFRAVDALLTNFHLPKSSLLMLVSALAGRERVLKAYDLAVKENYRFFSFGDCMFIS
jgi:S-adenosylmethionine:tRNA ribosyltransferase-isomerase